MEKDIETKTSWEILDEYFCKKSMMEILGVDRDENAHSKFLGWLFENKDTREVAIKSLLTLLRVEYLKQKEEYPNIHFPEIKEPQAMKINDVRVILEDFVEASAEDENGKIIIGEDGREIKYYGRADIVLEVTYDDKHLYVIIENKIDSFEHMMGKGQKEEDAEGAMWQTKGYYQYYTENKYRGKDCIFAFLTRPCYSDFFIREKAKFEEKYKKLTNVRKDGGPQCESFIWINYQDVLDDILTIVESNLEIEDCILAKLRIKDYIRCLGINKTQDNLMAVSKDLEAKAWAVWEEIKRKTKKQINELNWENNKDFIQPLFKVLCYICEKNEKDEDKKKEKEQIREINKIINSKDDTSYVIKKDGNQCSVNGERAYDKNSLVYEVVRIMMEYTLSLEDINERYKVYRKYKKLPPYLFIDSKDFYEKKAKSTDKKFDTKWREMKDVDIYVYQSGWDYPIMRDFITFAEKLLPEYNIQEFVSKTKLEKMIELIK